MNGGGVHGPPQTVKVVHARIQHAIHIPGRFLPTSPKSEPDKRTCIQDIPVDLGSYA